MTNITRRAMNLMQSRKKDMPIELSSFETKRIEFKEKSDLINKRCIELRQDIAKLEIKAEKWRKAVEETEGMVRTKSMLLDEGGWTHKDLTDEAVQRLAILLKQAEGYLEVTERDIKVKREILTQSEANLKDMSSVLNRLQAIEYQRQVDENFRETYQRQTDTEESIIQRLDMESFTRELRKMEYTTEALLEITANNTMTQGEFK